MIELTLIFGSMFSSKTTKLIKIISEYEAIGKKTLFINHKLDTRCGENEAKTHSNQIRKCVKTENLLDLIDNKEFKQAEVIAIDEASFYEDLYKFIINIEDLNKKIYVGGLNGCSNRKPFGQINDLLPLADDIIHLKSLCAICKSGVKGIFSKRISSKKSKILVGDKDQYIACCRKCYFKP